MTTIDTDALHERISATIAAHGTVVRVVEDQDSAGLHRYRFTPTSMTGLAHELMDAVLPIIRERENTAAREALSRFRGEARSASEGQ